LKENLLKDGLEKSEQRERGDLGGLERRNGSKKKDKRSKVKKGVLRAT